jgi:hypothetical protein
MYEPFPANVTTAAQYVASPLTPALPGANTGAAPPAPAHRTFASPPQGALPAHWAAPAGAVVSAAQGRHAVASALPPSRALKVLGGQGVGAEAAAAQKEPAGQGKQREEAGEGAYVPAAQGRHTVGEDAPPPGLKRPAAQGRHALAFAALTDALYVPGAHSAQLDAPVAL